MGGSDRPLASLHAAPTQKARFISLSITTIRSCKNRNENSSAKARFCATPRETLFPNYPSAFSSFSHSQISTPARLIFVTHRDDIPCHPCSTEGANRWRLLAERGAAPEGSASSVEPPGASGDTARPNYMGPSGNGLVERMKAGESPWDQGRSVMGAPVRFQKAVPRSKENAAVERREARRSALWAGNPVR